MKIADYRIVFQEVPDEISLALSISGCTNNCDGCHSEHLKNDIGKELTDNYLVEIIDNYIKKDPISCILFLGGDNHDKFYETVLYCKKIYPNLKIALYSGKNEISSTILDVLDYVKIGPYIKELGGLSSEATNQRIYKKMKSGLFSDITQLFQLK